MCGIDGFYSWRGSISGKEFYDAHSTLSHRGPDDEGFFFGQGPLHAVAIGDDTDPRIEGLPNIKGLSDLKVVLGHRRLSIIDLSEAGHQPFEVGGKVLSYNGELYNYVELRNELVSLGVEFHTSTDTEVFLAAFVQWGEAAFSKFNGMWAAAIYDKETNELILTRDRFGIKPLFFTITNAGLYFSSEIKFFKALDLIAEPDEQAIFQYIRYAETDFDDTTFFKGIHQVEPGCYLKFNGESYIKQRYWSEQDLIPPAKHKLDIYTIFLDSLKLRLRSDVAVGSLLSGGIDSSLIVGCINELTGLENFKAYSAVFHEKEFSEKKFIDKNSNQLGFKPRYIFPAPADLVSNIEELLYVQEMPFRSLSVLSQHLIYREIGRQGSVKVLLNGQGADEIFTGYTSHFSFYFLTLFINFRWGKFAAELFHFCKKRKIGYLQAMRMFGKDIVSYYFSPRDKYKIFHKVYDRKRVNLDLRKFSPLRKKLYQNLSFSALREYLRYEDRNSMYYSLESRLPFLDYRLVQAAFSLKDEDLIRNGETKIPVRRASKGRVHESIINRTDKTGFVSPQQMWQKKELVGEFDSVFAEISQNGLFKFLNTESIDVLYKSYKSGDNDDWAFIWRIYCLYKWKQQWLESCE